MDSREIRLKLSEAESGLEASERELKNSQASKANNITHGNFDGRIMERIDKGISEAKANIENLVPMIDLLKDQLPVAEKKEEAEKKQRAAMLKTLDPAIRKKSDLFVKRLQEAVDLNKQILTYHAGRLAIERKTGKSIGCRNICGGFHSLELLSQLAEGESRGIPRTGNRWSYWIKNKLGSDAL